MVPLECWQLQPSQSAPSYQRLKRTLLAGVAVLALSCVSAPAAFAVDPDFTWDPPSPVACEEVTFMQTGDAPDGVTWQHDGTPADSNPTTFTTEGTHQVTMNVTNGSSGHPRRRSRERAARRLVRLHPSSAGSGGVDRLPIDLDRLRRPGHPRVGPHTTAPTLREPIPSHKFDTAGPHDVTLTVSDGTVTDATTQTVYVGAVPIAAFHRDPLESVLLEAGQQATFTSDSTASANNSITSSNWDVDGDGFDDGSGTVLTHTFTTPGTKVVRLEVEQTNGERDIAVILFEVNAPPVAGFVWSPSSPVAGGVVQLFSTSGDAEGALASEAWELDGDGDFDDATGSSTTASFGAGDHEVSLRVTDGDGVSRVITRTITVAAAPVQPAPHPRRPPPSARRTPAHEPVPDGAARRSGRAGRRAHHACGGARRPAGHA